MKIDTAAAATEAALGLLGLSSQSPVADARTISQAVIPLKRKSSVMFEDEVRELGRLSPLDERGRGQDLGKNSSASAREKEKEKENLKGRDKDKTILEEERDGLPPPRPRNLGKPKSRAKQSNTSTDPLTIITTMSSDDAADQIRCVCEISDDDGLSIACDKCGRWVHAACFGFESKGDVPDEWFCWVCVPRAVDKAKAAKAMRARQRAFAAREAGTSRAAGVDAQAAEERGQRKVSPGVERKPRRAIDGSGNNTKRRRRASLSTSATSAHPPPHDEDEQIDIDEPATHEYIFLDTDLVPLKQTREMLRRAAHSWRGATALDGAPTTPVILSPDAIPSTSSTTLRPLPSFHQPSPSVRPPTYAVHTTHPIPSQSYIAPYTSTITPSKQYLSDPLNSYAHLSIPKPYVHLVGPPLDVALDARLTGRETRYVRSGCRPNAVLRPVLCSKKKREKQPQTTDEDEAESLSFAVFALKDLKANEEVVLGWEWDDGSVIHHLPALIDSPHLFAPLRLQQFRNQMTSMLHALSSTFTTCACGSKARDCALTRLAEFVEQPRLPHSHPPLYSTITSTPISPTPPALPHENRAARDIDKVDLGPLIGKERGFRTREKVPMSGGMSGVEMVPPTSDTLPPSIHDPVAEISFSKGKAGASEDRMAVDASSSTSPEGASGHYHSSLQFVNRDSVMPPRLRKSWIREKAEVLRRSPSPVGMAVDSVTRTIEENVEDKTNHDTVAMPPPSLPAFAPSSVSDVPTSSTFLNTTLSSSLDVTTSPSARFANLSLLSPAIRSRSSYFATALNPVPHPVVMQPAPPVTLAMPVTSPTHTTIEFDKPEHDNDGPSTSSEPFRCRSSPRHPSTQSSPTPLLPPVLSPSNAANILSETPPSPAHSSPETIPLPKPSLEEHDKEAQPLDISLQDSNLESCRGDQQSPASFSVPPLLPSIARKEPTPPQEPTPEPTPPPAPPKKKISMGDYLSRKREAKAVSPAVVSLPLVEMKEQEVKSGSLPAEPVPDAKEAVALPPTLPSFPPPPPPRIVRGFDDFWLRRRREGVDALTNFAKKEVESALVADISLGAASSEATPLLAQAVNGHAVLLDEELSRMQESVPPDRVKKSEKSIEDSPTPGSLAKMTYGESLVEALQASLNASRYTVPDLSRQPSQEDGEILSPPPPKAPPLAPRHPRSFSHSGTSSPVPPSSSYRRGPPLPSAYSSSRFPPYPPHPLSGNARPLPNAPRALRGVSQPGSHASSQSVYSSSNPSPPSRPLGPPVPRGPSVDRNRDWDRDRARDRVRSSTGGWHGSR